MDHWENEGGLVPSEPDWSVCRDCGRKPHAGWCHTEMLRQAREEAWEEGMQAAEAADCCGCNLRYNSETEQDVTNPHKT